MVPGASEGVLQEGLPARGPARAARGDGQEEGVHRHRHRSCMQTATPSRSLTSWTRWASPTPRSIDVAPDPTLACAKTGAGADARLRARLHHRHRRRLRHGRGQDHVGALRASRGRLHGHGHALHGHPQAASTPSPRWAKRPYFIAVPTTAGTGSEVTPFAVITDEHTGVKYPLADYELMPNMAIVDADMMMNAPKGADRRLGHRRCHPRPGGLCLHDGHRLHRRPGPAGHQDDLRLTCPGPMTTAPTTRRPGRRWPTPPRMAGMAFANAFLGVCHSMAHKLGAFHHLPHGVANALMICRRAALQRR